MSRYLNLKNMLFYSLIMILLFASCSAKSISSQDDISDSERLPKRERRLRRMINGIEAPISEWSFLAQLELPKDHKLKMCSAVLISDFWLLTAAYCAEKTENNEEIKVMFRKDENSLKFDKYEVQSVVLNKGFSTGNHWDDDIALIELKNAAPNHVKRMPFQGSSNVGFTNCETAGWGAYEQLKKTSDYSKKNYNISRELMKIPVHFIPVAKTIERIPKLKAIVEKNHKLLYGGKFFSDADQKAGTIPTTPCVGDGGSPLICKFTEGEYKGMKVMRGLLIGAGGKTDLCNPKLDYSQIYIDVSKYEDWITGIISDSD